MFWLTFPSALLSPLCVSLSSKDQAEMDPADMEDVEEVEEEETGEDENSKGQSPCKDGHRGAANMLCLCLGEADSKKYTSAVIHSDV